MSILTSKVTKEDAAISSFQANSDLEELEKAIEKHNGKVSLPRVILQINLCSITRTYQEMHSETDAIPQGHISLNCFI